MIGSGIFIVSADISRQVGSPGWLLVVWIITGLLTLTAALSYGELAAMMPKAGGQYVYLREAFSPLWGFLYGWTLFLVIQTGTIAAVAVGFAKFLGVIWPKIAIDPDHFGLCDFSVDRAARRRVADRVAHIHEHARTKARQDRSERLHDHQNR
jgi:amino acid transporter